LPRAHGVAARFVAMVACAGNVERSSDGL